MTASPSSASAQSKPAQADVLFRWGKDLMKQQKFAEACAAFDGSYKLDPDVSTLLNHAACRAKNVQLATAWRLFTEAQRQTSDQPDAASMQLNAVAVTRAGELQPRLSKLSIDVAPDSRLDGLEVLRDADRVDPGAWSQLLPIDGGTYKIMARAPGHTTWSTTVVVKPERDIQNVAVPKLDSLTAAKPKPDERPPAPTNAPPVRTPPADVAPTRTPLTDAKPIPAAPIRTPQTDAKPTRVPPTDAKPTPAPPTRVTSISAPPVRTPPADVAPTRVPPTDAKPTPAPPTGTKPTPAPPTDAKPARVPPTSARTTPEQPQAPLSLDEPRSENLALTLSLGGTLVSWGLLIAAGGGFDNTTIVLRTVGGFGVALAPSFGHWYAGKYFPRGMWFRLASPLVLTAGVGLVVNSYFQDSSAGKTVGAVLALTGAGLFVYGTIDDIVTARSRVRQRNRGRDFAIAPVVTSNAAGLTLGGRF